MPVRRQHALVPLALVSLAAVSPHAFGAAFQLREDSAEGLGSAFAGSGSQATSPSTVFDNPAGMTQLDGYQIQLGGSIIAPSSSFSGGARNAFGLPVQGTASANAAEIGYVPHGFATYRVNPQLAVGLAVTAPFGLATTYPAGFVGRYSADKTYLETVSITPAIAYAPLPWLSFGAGISATYARAVFSSFVNSSTILSSIVGRPTLAPDGYFRTNGTDWAVGYTLGVLVKPTPTTNIGVTYHSRQNLKFSGTDSYSVPPPLSFSPQFASGGGTAKLTLPDTVVVSLTQRITPAWRVMADVTWTNWSQFKSLNVFRSTGQLISSTPEDYENSFSVALGTAYDVNDRLTLRAGTQFDKTPTTDAHRTARVPDGDRFWLAGGLSYKVLPNATLDFGYAHVFVRDASVTDVSPTGDVLSGVYHNSIDLVSLGTRVKF